MTYEKSFQISMSKLQKLEYIKLAVNVISKWDLIDNVTNKLGICDPKYQKIPVTSCWKT